MYSNTKCPSPSYCSLDDTLAYDIPFIWFIGLVNCVGSKVYTPSTIITQSPVYPFFDEVYCLSNAHPDTDIEKAELMTMLMKEKIFELDHSKSIPPVSLITTYINSVFVSNSGARKTAVSFVLKCCELLQDQSLLNSLIINNQQKINRSHVFLTPNALNNVPSVDNSDAVYIHGHEDIKKQLYDAIILPKLYYKDFLAFQLKLEIGILLFGPPG